MEDIWSEFFAQYNRNPQQATAIALWRIGNLLEEINSKIPPPILVIEAPPDL